MSNVSNINNNKRNPFNLSSTFSLNNYNLKRLTNEDKKMLEKMKERQRLEAHTIIEFEIKQQILRKEQEDHLNMLKSEDKDKEKKDKTQRDFFRHKKIEDLLERKKELEINLEEVNELISNEYYKEQEKEKENNYNYNNENNQYGNNDNENYVEEKVQYFGMPLEEAKDLIENNMALIDEEINKINLEENEEKKRKNQTKSKEELLCKKHKDFHEQSLKNYMEEYKKSYEIRQLEEKKKQKRLEILEEKRLQKIKEREKSMDIHKKRFEESNNKLEEKLKKESEAIAYKLSSSKEKRSNYQESQKNLHKNKLESQSQKQIEIKNFIEKLRENDEIKSIQLKAKMREIENHKKLIDKNKEEEIKERINELNTKSLKTKETRLKIDDQNAEENNFTMLRIKNFMNKSNRKKENIEREVMFNNEKNEQKRNSVELKIKRNEYIKEIERKKALEKIYDDYRKFDYFKTQKTIDNNKKRILSIECSNQRRNTLEKLEDLINKYKQINVKLN
jgi:hypothetical protein